MGTITFLGPRQDVTNVRDYGAKGDGTTNDTSAINAAIAACPTGGIVHFPRGRYMTDGGHVLSTACTITGTGRHQVFDSSSQVYLRNSANADMFTIATPHVTMRDVTLYGNKANQGSTSRGIVCSLSVGANYFLLDNVWVDSFKGDGVVLQSPATTLSGIISRCEIRLSEGYGLRVAGTASDVIVSDSYIDQNTQSGALISASDISFSNCHFWGNGTAGSGDRDGITFSSSSACRVVNCYLESHTEGVGIRFKTGSMSGHIVSACDIWNNGLQGIYAFGADRCSFTGNKIRRNNFKGQSDANGAGITLDTCTAMNVTGNVMAGSYPSSGATRQTYGYYEVGNTNAGCMFIGNVSRAVDHTAGNWVIGANASPTLPATPSSFNVG